MDEDEWPDPTEIKRELGQLFPTPRAERDTSNDPTKLPYLSADDLQAFVQQRAEQMATAADQAIQFAGLLDSDNDDNTDDLFSVTLDANAYLQATDRLRADGSLQFAGKVKTADIPNIMNPLLASPSIPPNTERARDVSEQELNRLHQAWAATQEALFSTETAPPDGDTDSEVHDKVLEDEQGFLNQSDVFVDSLMDQRKTEAAWVQRHGDEYRTRQDQAMLQLDEQIQEIEANLEWFVAQKGVPRCFRCESALNELELRENEGVRRKVCMICHVEDLRQRPGPRRR